MSVSKDDQIFNNIYRGKRVLVTGHTGFKGSWLTLWLTQMGASVAGFSKYMPTRPCLFNVLGLESKIRHYKGDIINRNHIEKVFNVFKPQIVFHLAAQPIVYSAYQDPKRTFDTNLGGTVNVLECIRHASSVQAAVLITSDKCYENVNIRRGYREIDRLGGEDPYSASKACAEIAFSAYYRSFFCHQDKVFLATARAGNVIGGGDWARDRIVPDCVRAWSKREVAVIRSPHATRPWQHVLEPVGGYLWLAANLWLYKEKFTGQSFNFGPYQRASQDVAVLADLFVSFWEGASWKHVPAKGTKKEALLLQLSPRKTKNELSWRSAFSFRETIAFTAAWYQQYYSRKTDMAEFSHQQIKAYTQRARQLALPWAKGR